ncbi:MULTISPECIES: alpha/beta hydrolase [Caulobacter]|jgi:pimeloyl-ACP methyl ester carboxylesterase|uniref:Putative hydrolase or acyltransferase of alpha/beta superfamily n=1 Tax=Caulobacter vibrioides OR37 TaxID=1292034 RepID=R0CM31_CAUVI|nr:MULTISPECIES: alpha/beta hydrolase [Caulobacter]ENZ77701.1 putative hydrolase or acyltransferase of alpha/beta superfamily [Caulobacter vibrioides OR37]MBQ1560401.1 alpha/beta hydrolase [Caulobacter sp.]
MTASPLPQLILLPGLLNDAELWRDQISGLADVARVWVPDLSPYATLHEMAQSVLAEAEPTFAVAGFSMGGYVAQEIARLAPERIERLALLDTSIRVDTPERAAQRRALNKAAARGGTFLGIGQAIMKSYIDASRLDDIELTTRIVDMTQRLGREVFLRQNSLERQDGEAALKALRVPLLIIVGENDQITPAEGCREMAAAIGCTHLVVIPNAGHMTPMEAPSAVNGAIRHWLERPAGKR